MLRDLRDKTPCFKAYFETPNFSHSEQVATFYDEDLYLACRPQLVKVAKEHGQVVTESDCSCEDFDLIIDEIEKHL